MPELPDIELYLQALRQFILGRSIDHIQVRSPFVVRTYEPPLESCLGLRVLGFERLGKRIVWQLEQDLFLVFHLMIAGRFHWRRGIRQPRGKNDLAAFQFGQDTLLLTEAGPRKRAAVHVVRGDCGLQPFRPAGLEIRTMGFAEFCERISLRNHTLKRCLTDPGLFSGIGNAYSDEILHAARLSPIQWTSRLDPEETRRLYDAIRTTLATWQERLCEESQGAFPEKVTAFRPGMAVHGRYNQPCPECGVPIQRIRYADRETNYCPECQTGGKILADRSLSRLLKDDWPRTLEDLETEGSGGTE